MHILAQSTNTCNRTRRLERVFGSHLACLLHLLDVFWTRNFKNQQNVQRLSARAFGPERRPRCLRACLVGTSLKRRKYSTNGKISEWTSSPTPTSVLYYIMLYVTMTPPTSATCDARLRLYVRPTRRTPRPTRRRPRRATRRRAARVGSRRRAHHPRHARGRTRRPARGRARRPVETRRATRRTRRARRRRPRPAFPRKRPAPPRPPSNHPDGYFAALGRPPVRPNQQHPSRPSTNQQSLAGAAGTPVPTLFWTPLLCWHAGPL